MVFSPLSCQAYSTAGHDYLFFLIVYGRSFVAQAAHRTTTAFGSA